MGFHGIRRAPFQMTQSVPWNSMQYSMEFHGSLVPPNINMTYFHGNPLNFEIVILINTMLPLTCMGYSMELHRTLESPNKKNNRVPRDSMELGGRHFKDTDVPWNSMEYSMEFRGTLVPTNEISLSSIEFHGIFHGIPWNFGAAKWSIT